MQGYRVQASSLINFSSAFLLRRSLTFFPPTAVSEIPTTRKRATRAPDASPDTEQLRLRYFPRADNSRGLLLAAPPPSLSLSLSLSLSAPSLSLLSTLSLSIFLTATDNTSLKLILSYSKRVR